MKLEKVVARQSMEIVALQGDNSNLRRHMGMSSEGELPSEDGAQDDEDNGDEDDGYSTPRTTSKKQGA